MSRCYLRNVNPPHLMTDAKRQQPGRRQFLQTGLCLLSSALPLSSQAAEPPRKRLLNALAAHTWLPATPRVRTHAASPPLASAAKKIPVSGELDFWVETNLALIQKYRINPLRAARSLAYLTAALHDTGVHSRPRYSDSLPHCAAVLSLTAGMVLEYFFPEEARGRWVGEALMLAAAHRSAIAADWEDIWQVSTGISQHAMEYAMTDRSARINALAQPPGNITLPWRAAPPLWSTRPTEPGAKNWRHWVVPPTVADRCPPPLCLDASAYRLEIEKVYVTHQQLTPEQKAIAEMWNLDLGTVTPPGVWVMKALASKAYQAMSLPAKTGLMSLLTTAMMDAFTACWQVKFTWWTERPITAIRRSLDANFTPHVLTPSFPSYVSGHAAVSGCASAVLSGCIPELSSTWHDAAKEAAVSRLYGGIHFSFDNDEGLALGRKVGESAVARFLA